MASLRFEEHGGRRGWRLQFRDIEKRRRSLWLGGEKNHPPSEVKAHIEHIVARSKRKLPPELATSEWLEGITKDLRHKLATCGLVESEQQRLARVLTLAEWCDEYISERQDVKPATVDSYKKARKNLVDHFGRKKLLRDVSTTDAKKWRVWLKTKGNRRDKERKTMAEETVRRRTGTVKQFFTEAVERGYIMSNPFSKLASTTQGNEKRQHFVPASAIEACMDHCPCDDWRTILALARYGGLRCPSELVVLRWCDVDLPGGKMTINASKTEHHSTGGVRVCPIFPELRPYLERAWDNTPDGPQSEFVVNRYRRPDQNLRQTFLKILKRAGIEPWPRLFQNMRASRETELMARYPAKDVSAWLGNSVPVAMRHYAMATDESFIAASDPNGSTTSSPPSKPQTRGVIGGVISGGGGAIERSPQNEETPVLLGKTGVFIVQDSRGSYYLVGDEGLEPPTSSV